MEETFNVKARMWKFFILNMESLMWSGFYCISPQRTPNVESVLMRGPQCGVPNVVLLLDPQYGVPNVEPVCL